MLAPVEKLLKDFDSRKTFALARAVKCHIEHRVFLNGQKTVVFR